MHAPIFFFLGTTLWTYSVTFNGTGVTLSWWAIMQAQQTSSVYCVVRKERNRIAHSFSFCLLFLIISPTINGLFFVKLCGLIHWLYAGSMLVRTLTSQQYINNQSSAYSLHNCNNFEIIYWQLNQLSTQLHQQIFIWNARHLQKSTVRKVKPNKVCSRCLKAGFVITVITLG